MPGRLRADGTRCTDDLKTLRCGTRKLVTENYTGPEGSADNVVQALEDIAGALRLQHREVNGLGELPARVHGHVKDGAEDPQWRRVNLVLNRQVVLELHAPKVG